MPIARAIGPGETSTYGEVAKALGEPGAARAVGKALGENPWPIVVPCHRVLAASRKEGGGMGGFSAPGGTNTKAQLLTIERARTNAVPTLFDLEFFPRRGAPSSSPRAASGVFSGARPRSPARG
jgi:methylated-DNA-[protein]-cysteine S-methyltransferase